MTLIQGQIIWETSERKILCAVILQSSWLNLIGFGVLLTCWSDEFHTHFIMSDQYSKERNIADF